MLTDGAVRPRPLDHRTVTHAAEYAVAVALVGLAACAPPPGDEPLKALVLLPGAEVPQDLNHFGPEWSPDGSTIIFSGQVDGVRQVHAMDADGSNQRTLTQGEGPNGAAIWSPDGTRIAFVSERGESPKILVMNADGSDPRPLGIETGGGGERPDWSPDGSRLVFHAESGGGFDLWTVAVDGSSRAQLTDTEGNEQNPAWSPDGSRVAYMADHDGDWEIHVLPLEDRGSVTVLTRNEGGYDGYPQWSPDGSRIAFISDRDGWAIYTMNADGSEQTRLTTAPDWNFDPHWSPDGSQIAFSSRRDGRRGIYTMGADGSNQTKLTNRTMSQFVDVARNDGVDVAIRRYRASVAAQPDAFFFLPAEVNLLARAELDAGRPAAGLALLELNTEAYPESAGNHRSLAEALLASGDTARAIASYRRLLEIDSQDERAQAALEALIPE
jgi:TolB protein